MLSSPTANRVTATGPEQFEDRRGAVRYPVNADTTCPLVMPVTEDLGPARVRDISPEGIGMLLSHHVEPGTYLVVTLKNDAQKLIRTQLVQVAHCTKAAGGYLIGGTFVTPLTYDEMTKFVM